MAGDKKGRIYYSMGEVSEMFDVNPSLIRFWEQKFDILRPKKNKKGNRLFTPEDVENLKLIYHLVKENGMTLAGAQKRLKADKAGAKRDQEIIDRLYSIRSLLMEIGQELKIGADEPAYPDAEPEIPATTKSQEPEPEEDALLEAGIAAEPDGNDLPEDDVISGTAGVPSGDIEEPDGFVITEDRDLYREEDVRPEGFTETDMPQEGGSEDISPDDYATNIAVTALSSDEGSACACNDDIADGDIDFSDSDDLFASLSENADEIPSPGSTPPLPGVEAADAILDDHDIDPEYIAMISEQAALAAEVMDTIAEMDGRRKDGEDAGPRIVEQTLF